MTARILKTALASFFAVALAATAQNLPVILHQSLPPPSAPPASGDLFGASTAVSGTRLAVGAPGLNTHTGGVYIFDAGTLAISPSVTIDNPDPNPNDDFGIALAISGSLLVVGAPGDDVGNTDAGSAYVYDLSSDTPAIPLTTLHKPSPAGGDHFGASVSISGNRVVVGADGDDTGATDAGSAYVYDLSSANPAVPIFVLNNPQPGANDHFGTAVAIAGSRVVVGTPTDTDRGEQVGGAFVYDLAGPTPTAALRLFSISEEFSSFGRVLALSGSTLVVGAPDDFTGGGSIYIYDLASPTPTAMVTFFGNPVPSYQGGRSYGTALSLSGSSLVVGTKNPASGVLGSGHAYFYNLATAKPYTVLAVYDNPTPHSGDNYGSAVTIDGDIVAIGVPSADTVATDKGFAYVFGPNHPPTLVNDTIHSPAGHGPFTFDVLANDSDPDGDTFTITAVTDGQHGTVTTDGATVSYARGAGYDGNDSFTYTVTDVHGATATGTVTLTNSLPVGAPDNATTTEGQPVVIPVLANDSDGDAVDVLTVVTFTQGTHGSVDGDSTGVFNYTPDSGFVGTDTFTYTISDDRSSGPAPITVTVTVQPIPPTFQIVASTGGAAAAGGSVPNAGTDPKIQAGAVWSGFGTPSVNNSGTVAYLGRWKAPSSKTPLLKAQSGIGIFVGDELLIKVGDEVPGVSGATFKSFKDPVLDDLGHVAFIAAIAGLGVSSANDTVVVTNGRDGTLEVLAREGGVAPDIDGTPEPDHAVFKAFTSVSIQSPFPVGPQIFDAPTGSQSGIVFTASLLPGSGTPAVTSKNDTGAWWLPSGGDVLNKVVREGDFEFGPTEAVKSFELLKSLSGSPGQGRGQTLGDGVLFQAASTAGKQGIVSGYPDDFLGLTLTGEPLLSAILPGATWAHTSLPSSDLAQQHLSVLATLTPRAGGVTSANAKGIFLSQDFGDSWEPLVRLGDQAPNLPTGAVFSALKDPVNSAFDGGVAFIGSAKGGGVTTANNDGLWWQQGGSTLTLIAREGDQPPGAPTGAKWKSFTSVALPGGSGGPVFTALLQKGTPALPGPGGVTGIDDLALYGVDGLGVLHELLRENQPALGKTVKTFSVLKATAGSPGVTHAFNSFGQVLALVTFMDHTTAIVAITLPGAATGIVGPLN